MTPTGDDKFIPIAALDPEYDSFIDEREEWDEAVLLGMQAARALIKDKMDNQAAIKSVGRPPARNAAVASREEAKFGAEFPDITNCRAAHSPDTNFASDANRASDATMSTATPGTSGAKKPVNHALASMMQTSQTTFNHANATPFGIL